MKGVGYGSTVVAGLVGCYYNVIIAWCLFYLGSSIQVSQLQIAPDIAAGQFPSFFSYFYFCISNSTQFYITFLPSVYCTAKIEIF